MNAVALRDEVYAMITTMAEQILRISIIALTIKKQVYTAYSAWLVHPPPKTG
jgi:hypothetical protein